MIELADSSAWIVSRRNPELKEVFDVQLLAGAIATCDMVRFELLRSARNGNEFKLRRSQFEELKDCPIEKDVWSRALSVYEQLAFKGGSHQRSVQHADLLIAAAAEQAGVGVLHYDEDFDRIAKVTGQSVRWIAPRGSI